MTLFSTEVHHVERRLDIYCPLPATLKTDNSFPISFYCPCLSLTASLAHIHSCTISDCYNVSCLFLKFVLGIRDHPAFLHIIHSLYCIWLYKSYRDNLSNKKNSHRRYAGTLHEKENPWMELLFLFTPASIKKALVSTVTFKIKKILKLYLHYFLISSNSLVKMLFSCCLNTT